MAAGPKKRGALNEMGTHGCGHGGDGCYAGERNDELCKVDHDDNPKANVWLGESSVEFV